MLRAFKTQLKSLTEVDQFNFESHIRERGVKNPEIAIESARNLILTMPDLLERIQGLFGNPKIPSGHKRLHGFILTYLYHPKDFIPWTSYGLFGYLDDAYLTGLVFMKVVRNLDYYDVKESSKDLHHFQESVPRWLKEVEKIIPMEAMMIQSMLDEIESGETLSFEGLFSDEASDKPAQAVA